jgi:hypothetical protein
VAAHQKMIELSIVTTPNGGQQSWRASARCIVLDADLLGKVNRSSTKSASVAMRRWLFRADSMGVMQESSFDWRGRTKRTAGCRPAWSQR